MQLQLKWKNCKIKNKKKWKKIKNRSYQKILSKWNNFYSMEVKLLTGIKKKILKERYWAKFSTGDVSSESY